MALADEVIRVHAGTLTAQLDMAQFRSQRD